MIEVDGQGQGLGMQCAVGLDVIDQIRGSSKARLQRGSLKLTRTLKAPKRVGNSVIISSGPIPARRWLRLL